MSDYVDKTIEAYDHAPDKYSSATVGMVNKVEMDIMLGYLPSGDLPILDVGCANGRDSKVLSDLGYKTAGIDLSQELLKIAKREHPKLSFSYMDVRKLNFDDESFSGAWCNAVLLHLNENDLVKALKEIRRVLVPRGVIAVSFKEGAGERNVIERFSTELSRFYNFKSLENLNHLLESCGFQVKESYVLNEKERFGNDKRDLNWVWPFATKE